VISEERFLIGARMTTRLPLFFILIFFLTILLISCSQDKKQDVGKSAPVLSPNGPISSIKNSVNKRVVLIVGNGDYNKDGDYDDVGDLIASKADTEAMTKLFKTDLSFDTVIVANNVNRKQFRKKLSEFEKASISAEIAVFYYSGHGLVPPEGSESKMQNYLAPVGVDFADEDVVNDLEAQTISLSSIRKKIERKGLKTIFLLDACRNNPFGEQMALQIRDETNKSVNAAKGLVIEVSPKDTESMIAFAATHGQVAIAPTDGSTSYFTRALSVHLKEPVALQVAMSNVRGKVRSLTDNKQEPETVQRLNSALFLSSSIENGNKHNLNVVESISEEFQSSGRNSILVQMRYDWDTIKASVDIEEYKIFVVTYKNTQGSEIYIRRAKAKILQLEKSSSIAAESDLILNENQAFYIAKKSGRITDLGEYVLSFPDGKHVEEASELAWESANRQNSVLAFKTFKNYFPHSVHNSTISTKITEIPRAEKTENPESGSFIVHDKDVERRLEVIKLYSADNTVDDIVIRGFELFDKSELISLADQGASEAMMVLGYAYYIGEFVELDDDKAVQYMQESCKLNLEEACGALGVLHYTGTLVSGYPRKVLNFARSPDKAVKYFERGCLGTKYSSLEACNSSGVRYLRGEGVATSEAKARTYFFTACNKGLSTGCYNLGDTYFNSISYSNDGERGIKYHNIACDASMTLACIDLGKEYETGNTIIQNYNFARVFYDKACELNNPDGCNLLGMIYFNGKGVTKSKVDAVHYFTRSCEQGWASGCLNTGRMWKNGSGVKKKDLEKAREFFQEACRLGSEEGCIDLR